MARKRRKNEIPAEIYSECRGHRVRFRPRKYGATRCVWASVEIDGAWISLGGPWKGSSPPAVSEIEEAVRLAEVDSL